MSQRFSAAAISVLLTVCIVLIMDRNSRVDPSSKLPLSSNHVSDERLAPRLLEDSDEMAAYIADFPEDQYDIHEVFGVGNFYIDNTDDFIKKFIVKGAVWEPNVVDMINKYAGYNTTMIDAGAHIGTHTLVMSRLAGPYGRVYSFEPQKKIYRELVYNLVLNAASNVVPLRFAVGSEPGVIEMSVLNEDNEGGTPIGEGGDKAELRTIDSFQFNNVSLIKIDVEGFEDQVLAGARETISANHPFLIVEVQGGYQYDTAPESVKAKILGTTRLIQSMGYVVARFGPYDYLGVPQRRMVNAGIELAQSLAR